MAHCSLCKRAARALVYERHNRNVCAPCTFAIAQFVVSATDAVVAELWCVELPAPLPPSPAWEPELLESVQRELDAVQALRAHVSATADDDAATHFELGIAYREMGLYDDAVREFELVRAGPVSARYADAERLRIVTLDDAGRAYGAIRAAAAFVHARKSADVDVVHVLLRHLPPDQVERLRTVLFVD